MRSLIVLLSLIMISFSFISCDQLPEEGTIIYDVDFPRADSCEATGTCNSGGGGGGGGTYVPPVITPGIPSVPSGVTVVNPTFTETEGNTHTGTTIVLDSAPSGTVTISFTSGDTSEITVNSPSLTFTPANYSTPQVIVMTAVEDFINIPTDSNTTTGIAFSISSTNTSDLVHGRIGNLVGYVLDSGRTLFTIGGGTPTIPEGQSDNSSYTFVLNDMPNGVVTVTLTSTDTNEVLIGSPLVFTPGSYNVPQNLSLTGVEDYIVDGLQDTNITVTYTSTDPTDIQDGETNTFIVNTTDSGQSSVTLDDANPSVAEGSSYTGTIVLDAAPAGTVTITLTSDDVGEAQLVPDPTVLTFTPVNWNSPQNYTVNGIEDLEIDGPVETNINIVASSTDPTDSIHGLNTSFTMTTTDSGIDGPYTINPTTPSVTEGTTDNMTFVLNYPPTDTVTITLTSGGADEAGISPTTLTFTPVNWNSPQTVIVTGVEDFVVDNDQLTAITTTISSNDSVYDNSTGYFNITTVDSGRGPTSITSAVAGDQQVTLNWSGPTGMDGYVIYYTNDGSTPTLASDNVSGISGTVTSYVHSGLTSGLTYTYRIVANLGSDSSGLSPTVSANLKPATPTGLTATNPGSGTSINLTWNASTGADNYTVYWTDDPSTPIDPSNPATYDGSTTVTGTSTTATGLTAGTPYDFTIVATNNTAGSSPPATEVNATPTLIMPAAIDNVTAYHGFYGDATIYTASNPDRYSIFPPSYAITWNAHPDFVYSANGDYYKVFISDNLSQPIDPTDSSTYISQQWATTNQTVITTRPFITIDGVTHNDGFLENTPLRIAVVFEDYSKGRILSPVTEVTPTMASEAYRQWGDLRIHGGFFAAGDNSTLYGFGRSNGSDPIRIEHKDMVNVGERAIFDGAWLNSDVFPLMSNSAGYDYMFLTWYQPEKPFFNHNFSTNGTYFKRSRTSDWRLESNAISAGSAVGDYDFGMEFQAEDTVGLIIQHSSNRTGTLNGPTDYAAVSYADYAAGNGLYSAEHTGTSHWLDNSSYAGMTLFSTKNMYQINLANADAAISKVAIPFKSPDNLTVTPSGSNINLSWDNSTSFTNTYDIYRSTDNSTWSLVTSISGYTNTTYTDSSLADGTYYYKIGANGTYFTPDNSTVASGVISTTPAAPVLNSVTAGVQQNTIAWSAYTGATSYKLYWDTSASVSTSDNLITISDNTSTSYIHSGRTAGTQYYYRLIATTSGGDSGLSNELSDTPTALVGCTSSGAVADNDPDLLVHYAFEGNLEDVEDTNGDNRYDLTNEEGTMQFAQGCAQGQAAYIDSASGYGVNNNFTSTNVGGNLANDNFSISLWVAKDGDMADYSSAFNTGFYNEHTPTGDQEKTQIDIQAGKFRAISNSPGNGKKVRSSFTPNMDQWYHVTLTHSPPSTVSLYTDGTLQETNTNMNIDFYGLVVGLNRSRSVGTLNWKGYIDEVKVFNRTFSADDVADDCMKSEGCPYVPATAPTLSADARAQAIMLTWNLPGGTDNATIYWRTSGGSFEGSPTAPTASDNVINVTNGQTSYLLTGLTGGDYYHFVILANNRNGSSPVSSVLGNVQPTSFIANTFDSGNNGGICKIQNDGSLKCKGRNNLDQFNNDRIDRPSATDIFGITNAETITFSSNKIGVVQSDGSYQHRGDNDGMSTRSSPVTGVTNPVQVEHGYNFVAYLMSDGTVRTRGANYNGQLGDGTTNNETSGSVQVSGITTANKISAGQYHACALLTNGQIWCWGDNSFGELGDGTTTQRETPVQAGLPTDTAVGIFVSQRTSAAVLANGKVYIWGSNVNSRAKCSNNTSAISNPRELTVISNVKQIDFGFGHSVILTNDGNVYTCGTVYSTSNVAGNATFFASMGTEAKTNGAILMDDYQGRVIEVRADNYNSYMLLDNGSLACIGDNNYGQCNNDGATMGTDQLTPIIIPDM